MLIILLLIILCVYFYSEDRIIAEYEYHVEINPKNNTLFVIFIPFPIDIKNSDKPSTTVLNKIDIMSGIGEYNINETDKGVALKISSSNKVILESKGSFKNNKDYPTFLSLQLLDENGERKESGESEFWIYSDTDAKIEIKYYVHAKHPDYMRREYNISGDLTSGWNLVQGYIKSEVS